MTVSMTPRLRKLTLIAHITSSVGWLGAAIVVLALAITATTSQDVDIVRAAHLATQVIGWTVLIPLAFASLLTGLVQSLGTAWGLFRHHWVLLKLAMTVLATVVLLLYTETLDYLAGIAAQDTLSPTDLVMLRTPSVVLHSGAALVLLLTAATLSVLKPQGMTRYGRRRQQYEMTGSRPSRKVRSASPRQ